MIDAADLPQMGRRAADVARRALRWWGEELWHLLPPRLRYTLGVDPMAAEIVLVIPERGSESVAVQTFRNGRPRERLEVQDWLAALVWVAERRRRWGALMRIDLVLPSGACLIRQREVPAVAGSRTAEVLALELERTTPFSPRDVRQGWRLAAEPGNAATRLVDHVVAKRHLADAVLAEAKRLRLPIAALDVLDAATGSRLGVNLLEPSEVPPSLARGLNGAIAIAAALLVAATVAAALIAVQRQEDALGRLEADIAAARKEALAARKRLQDADDAFVRIAQLRLRRAQDVRVVAAWEEVTRRLPETAWLTDMRIENDILWLDGYAQSASELVRIVAQSPMFSGVALSAPVTRDAAKAGERFQLRMRIEKIHRAQTADGRKGDG